MGIANAGASGGGFPTTDIDTSSELITLVTDETGTGKLVFATSPTLITPLLGTPTSGVLTNCTGYPLTSLAGDEASYNRLYKSVTDLTTSQISTLNSLPVQLVAGTANKITWPEVCIIDYTFGTSAFATARNINLQYGTSLEQLTPNFNSDNSFTSASGSTLTIWTCHQIGSDSINIINARNFIGDNIRLYAQTGDFSAVGTQTGTAKVILYYRILDIA